MARLFPQMEMLTSLLQNMELFLNENGFRMVIWESMSFSNIRAYSQLPASKVNLRGWFFLVIVPLLTSSFVPAHLSKSLSSKYSAYQQFELGATGKSDWKCGGQSHRD
jgi:hypothetical protein